jgi:uncharacterized membrane protein
MELSRAACRTLRWSFSLFLQNSSMVAETGPSEVRRFASIDILRGLLMVLMALDHVRDYLSNAHVSPTDPVNSWPALYATRWITHLCAPGFVALAGASVYLQRQRKTDAQLIRLLWTRGLWLIFLELTVIAFGFTFSFEYPTLQVIWAIGGSMLILAAMFPLPVGVVGTIGLAIVLLHNLLDPIRSEQLGRGQDLWELLHEAAPLHLPAPFEGFLAYPLLPWAGIFLIGYWFGQVVLLPGLQRRSISAWLGFLFLGVFSVLRVVGRYGDSNHFEHLASPVHTAMSFLNVNKYPPSLQFALVTLGILLVLFAGIDRLMNRDLLPLPRHILEVYGRVPLFYYVLHIYLIHTIALVLMMAVSHNWGLWRISATSIPGAVPGFGYSLPIVYGIWAVVVCALYLPCRHFARIKQNRKTWWMSYI